MRLSKSLVPTLREDPADAEALSHKLMLRAGLVNELKQLRSTFSLNRDMPSMRAVGYRQVWSFLEGGTTEAAMREEAIAATRQLAKRQMTWLRSFPELVRLDAGSLEGAAVALDLLLHEGR